jgi:Flp pilus assembly protein TadG
MRRPRRKRRGATVLEMSIILMVFLVLTMGMLDLGVGVFRYHILAQATRYVARRAIVHGDMATALGTWGPTTIDVTASTNGVPAIDGTKDGVRPMLVGCDLPQTHVRIQWTKGTNSFDSPVQVTVTAPYHPIMLFIFPNKTITLTASTKMQVAH